LQDLQASLKSVRNFPVIVVGATPGIGGFCSVAQWVSTTVWWRRFVAAIEKRIQTMTWEELLDARFDRFEAKLDKRFAAIDQRFVTMDGRFDGIDRSLANIDRRLVDVDRRFGEVDRRLDRVDHRLDRMDTKMDKHFLWVLGVQMTVAAGTIAAMMTAFLAR
jgi:hypothetical protein